MPPDMAVEDFVERGMRSAAVSSQVLSRAYLGSGRTTRSARLALRADAARLVTVPRRRRCARRELGRAATRSTLTGVADATRRHRNAVGRLAELGGAPRPDRGCAAGPHPRAPSRGRPHDSDPHATRSSLPDYPPATTAAEGLALLHVAGPRFGRGLADPTSRITARDLQDRIQAEVMQLTDAGFPRPTCSW
jgi:hypothetical protein